MKFIDIAEIYVKAGDGGKGHVSFRREKFVPMGGPDGGNGGKGGDVILKVDPHMNTLLDFKYRNRYKAPNGNTGEKANRTGKSGNNVYIRVPAGTEILDIETEEVIADLTEAGQEFVVARGGIGGLGNAEFTTPTNQAPRYSQPGIPGEERNIRLELKLIADIGIVGLPNVGKSTLISVISAAKPKIADYPFTTLVPNLGIVSMGEGKSFTVADIPGLIEGAHEGKGLGIQFLRHVERTRALVFLIDAFSTSYTDDYLTLVNELNKYNPEMKHKKKIICISRVDALDNDSRKAVEKTKFKGYGGKPIMLSSVSHENVEKLKREMWRVIEESE